MFRESFGTANQAHRPRTFASESSISLIRRTRSKSAAVFVISVNASVFGNAALGHGWAKSNEGRRAGLADVAQELRRTDAIDNAEGGLHFQLMPSCAADCFQFTLKGSVI